MTDEVEILGVPDKAVEPVKEKRRRTATLDDLKPVIHIVEIDDVDFDGEPVTLVFKMRSLTYFRYYEIGGSVIDPAPATIGVDRNGRPIFDTQSDEYRNKLNVSSNLRGLKRLAEALIEPEVPGTSLDEKAAWLQENIPVGIVTALIMALGATISGGEARIANRANSFHQI